MATFACQWLLAASLLANGLAGAGAIAFVHRKGGSRYLKSKLVAGGLVRDKRLEGDLAAYYRTKVELFGRFPVLPRDIVFLGDSMTDMGPWQELFPGLPVKNRGINGDTVAGVLGRLDQVLSPAPLAIFLLVGINDLTAGAPMERLQADYQALVTRVRAQAPSTHLVLQGLLPVDPFRWGARHETAVVAFNSHLAELARESGADFVDLRPLFEHDGRLDPALSHDGLHPNGAGYERWRSAIADRVATLGSEA